MTTSPFTFRRNINDCYESWWSTHLFLLHVEVLDDDTNEEVQGEEWPEDDEEDEVEVHKIANFASRLNVQLPIISQLLHY